MKNSFTLPNTPQCRVVYKRDGTEYGAIITTPKTLEDVRIKMMERQPPVASHQVVRIEEIKPLAPLNRNHPALRSMTKYATPAEH